MNPKLYPVVINRESSDWYRNTAVEGRNNNHLPTGFEMRWALGVYDKVGSFATGTYVNIFNLVIL